MGNRSRYRRRDTDGSGRLCTRAVYLVHRNIRTERRGVRNHCGICRFQRAVRHRYLCGRLKGEHVPQACFALVQLAAPKFPHVALQDVLHLTWWPLARDCSYYCFSLFTLAIFFGQVQNKPTGDSDSWVQFGSFCYLKEDGDWAKPQDCAAIHAWEAAVLFGMCADCITCLVDVRCSQLLALNCTPMHQVLWIYPRHGIQQNSGREIGRAGTKKASNDSRKPCL